MQLKNASLSLGHPPLLDNVELVIKAGERICLVGRNGCGKSTLLKVIGAHMPLDDGQRIVGSEVKISRLEQDPPLSTDISIFDYVAEELAEIGQLLTEYAHQSQVVVNDHSDAQLAKLERLQQQLEHHNGWQLEQQIQAVLMQLQLDGNAMLSSLSGGWRRKAALARALVRNPDILLLDEPTNHLDISMIQWLENALMDFSGAVVFVSHDRAFIRRLATRIVDLDRGTLTSYPGDYATYLVKKAEDLQVEATQNALFDKKLSQEETWIRQGIKARRTRNEGRVRALKALREEHRQRRHRQGAASITLSDVQRSGKTVFDVSGLHYQIDNKTIIRGLDLLVQRGDKLALVGANGCGKSTLIKLLLGDLEAQQGLIKRGTNLEIAYFDQHRSQLDPNKTLIDTIADGKRELTINGRSRHVISYLQDFLFSPERINVPVGALSGGEKNRLLLAKILAKPSNLLILDEPTNDLDVETLELLEEVLGQYDGTLLLVSHDREFVDNVVAASLYFEGDGVIREFVGGYQDIYQWYADKARVQAEEKAAVRETSEQKQSQIAKSSPARSKKLSYKAKLELEQLPGQIETMETEVARLQELVNQPDFFKQDAGDAQKVLNQLAELEANLSVAYERWDELEQMQEQ
ncbi:ABC transporter ATP-binding protein [Bowmanella sp. JS7-9]|uniref:ATP-binding protein Uup n=1 Tax=Pseudobowmanella zhangzhouensis TaxID=1537679 RepID=A0ABW1XLI5_9ALTE|nr:ABC transporter ATP-binding protein [Bowmanella sp. JS7-9]TBX26102.1 ABC transporter ATPase [Bowmanella sp. JS7-9]